MTGLRLRKRLSGRVCNFQQLEYNNKISYIRLPPTTPIMFPLSFFHLHPSQTHKYYTSPLNILFNLSLLSTFYHSLYQTILGKSLY